MEVPAWNQLYPIIRSAEQRFRYGKEVLTMVRGDRLSCDLQHLVAAVETVLPRDMDRRTRELAVSVCWLGPRRELTVSLPTWAALQETARRVFEEAPDVESWEPVLLFGAGWQRVPQNEDGWRGRWGPAIIRLELFVTNHIQASLKRLSQLGVLPRGGVPELNYPDVSIDTHASRFAEVITLALMGDECKCGRTNCALDHCIRSWPLGRSFQIKAGGKGVNHVWTLAKVAVNGSARKHLYAKQFDRGLLFRLILKHEPYSLCVGPRAVWSCTICANVPNSRSQTHLWITSKCPGCQRSFDETKDLLYEVEGLFPKPLYRHKKTWRCKGQLHGEQCGALVPVTETACPRCHESRHRRGQPLTLWYPGPYVQLPPDASPHRRRQPLQLRSDDQGEGFMPSTEVEVEWRWDEEGGEEEV